MRTIFYSLIAITAIIPPAVFAQDDNNLVNLPIGETGNFNDYINAVYLMFISIAALIAVVKIIIAGVKYMFSDIVTQKSDAKNDIKGALLGLLVVLTAVVVLTIINPDLTTFDPQISGLQERERVQLSTLTESDLLTIQEFCNANNGQCTTTSCDRLGTDYFVTWLINDPINRASCSAFCNGEIVGRNLTNAGSCLSVTGEVPVLLPELTETTIMPCIQIGETIDCTATRNTCINGYGGTAEGIDTNGVLQISCTPPPSREVFGCTEILGSIRLGIETTYNCQTARARCTGGRTATQNDSGQIVCETN